ncbi:cys met metabolism pyridoxal phosphate-dependent enzyme protein [Diplodia corticola]|uniref:Cys met metabolism pyridoxal phosphate-dependent enzyme protein n=1 Tax=Diplodia corticola TaxID=236234 RepID=A0A1J9QTB7_9PEZI|nr:cys met metabolism pyridoxal phosphate-dependent enzyme protein [Diplodia corticola]OJD31672.1 cys met metabolism pyridoxal phosphate-dependent enzyme protein [Diplodia corticola]
MARYTRETSPWKKRVLLPIWILRDGLTIIIIAMYAFILAVLIKDPSDELYEDYDDSAVNAAKAVVAVFMTLFIVSLLLDIWCMVQYVRHSLSPRTFLIINTLQLLFWIAIVVLQFIGNASYGRVYVGIFGIAALLLYISLFIYACTVFRRDRNLRASNSGHYAPAANPINNQLSAQEYGQTSYAGPYNQPPVHGVPLYDSRGADEELKPVQHQQYAQYR